MGNHRVGAVHLQSKIAPSSRIKTARTTDQNPLNKVHKRHHERDRQRGAKKDRVQGEIWCKICTSKTQKISDDHLQETHPLIKK